MKNFTFLKLSALSLFLFCFAFAGKAQEVVKTYNVSKGSGKSCSNTSSYSFSSYDVDYRVDPCKVFIGVCTNSLDNGLEVTSVIHDTPARQFGVEKGDIILKIDKVEVRSQSELIRQRDTHKQGEAFTLSILRDGVEQTINARFKECSAEEQKKVRERRVAMIDESGDLDARMQSLQARLDEMNVRLSSLQTVEHMSEGLANLEKTSRPIIGFYPAKNEGVRGVLVQDIMSGKGAEAAGLKRGDVIIRVDGKDLNDGMTIGTALKNHSAGDAVKVVFEREGKVIESTVTLSEGPIVYTYKVERDPCAVFIGVYTSGHGADGQGVTVSGIIDNTPAKVSAVQPGDIILALDGTAVNSYAELGRERDKHKPGERFSLTILRDGQVMEINAQFKSCDAPEKANPSKEEVVTLASEEQSTQQRNKDAQVKDLQLELFKAYPNPTFGPLNVRFEAEAIPTTVRIFDLSGKEVFTQKLNNFSGLYNEQINLTGKTPGNYVLSIEQGGKTFAKTMVLMPRV